MKINNNISAVITNKQLLGTESNLSASMERLSSGLKLNHASDNPAGMAISNKMKAQIRGLDQASRNSSDGTSVIQTVDGALGEVTDMLQRMRELAVQAENGVNSQKEKEACQLEIASLRDEVDRISQTTEFNTKSLLDGSLDARVYTDKENRDYVSRIYVSDQVAEGTYSLTVEKAATNATFDTGVKIDDLVGKNGILSINGYTVTIDDKMTKDQIYTALRDGAEIGECTISKIDEPLSFKSTAYGSHAQITLLQQSNDGDIFGAGVPNTAADPKAEAVVAMGKNAEITLDADSAFDARATVSYEGNKVNITNTDGFQMSFLLEAGFEKGFTTAAGTVSAGVINLEVTDIGIMDLQIGANEGQTMQVRIPATDVESLYLDDIDVTTIHGATKAMDRLDDAISKISQIRSQIGAYENRLDYTVTSLDETEENMTAALSRIEDVDMAEEMTEYTKYNVLQQAGTSVLAQANELPTQALQLLQ
ncbi:MAG: flagellin [Pseudobutyrivibrio sp.]|nr:flagellin [Pseudobutyrivibrio sp.]